MKYNIKALVFGGLAGATLVFIVLFWFVGSRLNQPVNSAAGIFSIKKGQTLSDIAFALKDKGVISDPLLLIWYGEATGKDKEIKAGAYRFADSVSVKGLLDLFGNGSNVFVKLFLSPGLTLKQAIARIHQAGLDIDEAIVAKPPQKIASSYKFLADAPAQASLEGFVYPDTYQFDSGQDGGQVIQAILNNFNKNFDSAWYGEIQKQGHSVYDTMIMASILEREVRTLKEKKIAAGILWKRLAAGMPLQLDSTINYVTGKNSPSTSYRDLTLDSPYNTYKYQGLPPTPISNPGLDSIKAAIYPTPSEYWFYLSRQDTGQTIFSRTYREHSQAKDKYL